MRTNYNKLFNSKRYIIVASIISTIICLSSFAEEAWHEHSLRLYSGYVDSIATINARDTYTPLQLGNSEEFGLGYSVTYNRFWDVELSLSQSKGSGVQRNAAGSGNESNSLGVSLEMKRLHLTGKFRFNSHEGILVPWIGGGINGGTIESREQEQVLVEGGFINKHSRTRTSSIIGVHGSAGIDFYPAKGSALAVALEARYNSSEIDGLFAGEISGTSILIGLKWDFWQKGL